MDEQLKLELRYAIEDAVIGEPLRPGLAQSAKTAAMGVLYRHGVRGARVNVHMQSGAIQVEVFLPAGPRKVERVVLQFGAL